jgi:small subunit ribosomal protein S8
MVNDTISDLLTRIRNANLAGHDTVDVLNTMNYRISELFKKKGILIHFNAIREKHNFTNRVKIYWKRNSMYYKFKTIKLSGLRLYSDLKISLILNGMGVVILSTSKGIMTDREARQSKVGEICSICKIESRKQNLIEMNGVVTQCLSNGMFLIKLENGFKVIAHISGKIRRNFIRILLETQLSLN